MTIRDRMSDRYWAFKDAKVLEQFCDAPRCYFVYLPQRTRKTFVDIYLRAGALTEDKTRAGIGHLLEHYLAALASKKLPSEVAFNAKINDDDIVFSISAEDRSILHEATDTLVSTLLHPDFSHHEIFGYEKKSLIHEIEEERNETSMAFERLVERARYLDEPNGRSFVDHLGGLASISLAGISHYHQEIIAKDTMTVFVSGLRRDRKLERCIEREVHTLPASEPPIPFPEPEYSGRRVVAEKNAVSGAYVSLSFPAYSRTAPLRDRFALNLLLTLINDPSQQGLQHALRKQGFYDFKTISKRGVRNGYIAFQTYVSDGKVLAWLEAVAGYIRAVTHSGPEATTFARLREQWTRDVIMDWRDNQSRFEIVSDCVLDQSSGCEHLTQKARARMCVLSADDIRHTAERIFDAEAVNLVILGEHTEHLAEDTLAQLLIARG
jgi:predicted Zn-dependent peptidase